MSKLNDLKQTMLIQNPTMMGEIWHNERMDILFEDVKSNRFNLEIMEWVKEQLLDGKDKMDMNCDMNMTRGQLKKVNAICKAKTKQTMQKRILSLSKLFVNSDYQSMFLKNRNKSWVEFCEKHGFEHGLVRTNQQKRCESLLNGMLANQ